MIKFILRGLLHSATRYERHMNSTSSIFASEPLVFHLTVTSEPRSTYDPHVSIRTYWGS